MPKAATRGPVPKRSTERRRRNKASQVETVKPLVANVPPLTADSRWHPIALDWFNSLAESGQSQFYEPSDWHAARFVADVMSRNLRQKKFSSVLFAAVWTAMGDLLTTEADRRRVRMEIDRGAEPEQPAGVVAIADYRKSLSAAGSRKS